MTIEDIEDLKRAVAFLKQALAQSDGRIQQIKKELPGNSKTLKADREKLEKQRAALQRTLDAKREAFNAEYRDKFPG